MKNGFYFMVKALFVLEILTFLSRLYGYVEKRLYKKAKLITKFMTQQNGQQIITIHILPNISRSNGNQTMKFGQLMKYKMRKKIMHCGGEASPRPFY